jgi:hypothetical protein
MHWKQIWQEGEIAVQFSDGATVQIPYRAAVDLEGYAKLSLKK